MPKSAKAGSVVWSGKNLSDVKALHKDVAHYPEGKVPHSRDWSQHPDNLHVEDQDGNTLIVEIGDAIVRDEDGNVTVKKAKNPREPRALRAVPPASGRTINVVQHASPARQQVEDEEATDE